jgi:N4-gp56 family major capsid protein
MAIPQGLTTGTGDISNLVKTAYDQYVRMALRSIPVMRALADVKPVQQAMPGSSVVFSIYSDLAKATSTLNEGQDVSSVALGNPNQVTVTLNEYGSAVTTTKKLNLTSFNDVDAALADIIAYNAADSIDNIVGTVLSQGQNVLYGGTATNSAGVVPGDNLTVALIREAVVELRTNKAVPRMGELYAAYVHPRQSADLRAEYGSGGFQELTKYVERTPFVAGAVGVIEGAYVVETPRVLNGLYVPAATYSGGPAAYFTTQLKGNVLSVSGTTMAPTLRFSDNVMDPPKFSVGQEVFLSDLVDDNSAMYGLVPWSQFNGVKLTITGTTFGPTEYTVNVPASMIATWSGFIGAAAPAFPQWYINFTNNYRAIIAGREALAEALAQDINTVIGPEIDTLRRFRTIGWYAFAGWNRLREAALYRIETSATNG